MFVSNHNKNLRRPRHWLGGLGLLGVCLGVWLSSGIAAANPACGCVSSGIAIWPTSKQAAPRNTHVWVRFPAQSTKLLFGRYQEFKNYPNLWTSSFTLEQIKVVLLHEGRLVPALRLGLKSAEWRMLIIQPQGLLAPGKRYDVHLGVGAWGAVIGHFTTGTEVANTKPPAVPVASARFIRDRRIRGRCLSPSPYTAVHLRNAPDLVRAPFLGIWAPNADGTIPFKQPPNLILPAQDKRFFLGRSSYCGESNFPLSGGPSTTFGIRAGNLAGQWGPPSMVTFASGAATAPWTWSPNMRVVFWVVLAFLLFLLGMLRAWFVQRTSFKLLDEFAFDHSAIKSDVSWLALRKVVEKEAPYRRANIILFVLQLVLLVLGLYVLLRSMFHFVVAHTSLSQLTIVVGTLGLFLTLNALINLMFTRRVRNKRHVIGSFPVGANFEQPCSALLKGWRKKNAPPPETDEAPARPTQKGASA